MVVEPDMVVAVNLSSLRSQCEVDPREDVRVEASGTRI